MAFCYENISHKPIYNEVENVRGVAKAIFNMLEVNHTTVSYHKPPFYKGTSARVRIRAKLKHISQRSAIIETNQDSLSNGE